MGLTLWTTRRQDRFELSIRDSAYPTHLRDTPEPPPILYGIGDPAALDPGLAVVGARKATPYGRHVASLFAGWAASAGYTIISGAAVGCDQAAHNAALDNDGTTIAVLGCGADVTYPCGCTGLLNRIAANGAVVSELPWETPPQRWAFRRRNRIIAGLGAALLVVEACLPSGTFSTAEYAVDAGRDVLAIPGSILAPECRGPNRLIRQGATPIVDVTDLAMELERLIGPPRMEITEPGTLFATSDDLLTALTANPMRPDDAAVALGLDIVTVARRLGMLEARGLVRKYPDGRYGPGK